MGIGYWILFIILFLFTEYLLILKPEAILRFRHSKGMNLYSYTEEYEVSEEKQIIIRVIGVITLILGIIFIGYQVIQLNPVERDVHKIIEKADAITLEYPLENTWSGQVGAKKVKKGLYDDEIQELKRLSEEVRLGFFSKELPRDPYTYNNPWSPYTISNDSYKFNREEFVGISLYDNNRNYIGIIIFYEKDKAYFTTEKYPIADSYDNHYTDLYGKGYRLRGDYTKIYDYLIELREKYRINTSE